MLRLLTSMVRIISLWNCGEGKRTLLLCLVFSVAHLLLCLTYKLNNIIGKKKNNIVSVGLLLCFRPSHRGPWNARWRQGQCCPQFLPFRKQLRSSCQAHIGAEIINCRSDLCLELLPAPPLFFFLLFERQKDMKKRFSIYWFALQMISDHNGQVQVSADGWSVDWQHATKRQEAGKEETWFKMKNKCLPLYVQ